MTYDSTQELPTLDPGVTLLRRPDPRDAVLHRLVVAALRRRDGGALWVDARNEASTAALYAADPAGRTLDGLRVARAFTAYQHHELVRSLPGRATPRTALVVVPRLPSLYRDPDLPEAAADRLFDASLAVLRELADALDVRVLVTADGADDGLTDRVREAADDEVVVRRTGMGLAFEGDSVRSDVYWHDDWWQTTIPYWVELCGVAPDDADAMAADGPRDPLQSWLGGAV
ncbi:hypothetical protein SAMN04487947_2154 [Halogeometricum rufum]|uniref:Uncharacterized protein n=1 Tax=Halogeometricum rufum TaxID=553469 RepID=A0A1I6HJM9_9EURY|nr:hypothetical protein [Halogeometricum rufum]SFR54682.1 hypothetical protein SAMN04487947_2154 [Halogeometricum rufum]